MRRVGLQHRGQEDKDVEEDREGGQGGKSVWEEGTRALGFCGGGEVEGRKRE